MNRKQDQAPSAQAQEAAVPHEEELAVSKSERERQPVPKFTQREDGQLQDAQDQIVNRAALFEALATVDIDLAWNLLSQAASTVKCADQRVDKVNFAAAALHSMAPRDGIEALLCVQMAGVHNLAMHFLATAAMKGQTDVGTELYVNRANRLLRTFTAQVEALKIYRNKGEQKVEVKHVHVHRGGQAVVGTINHARPATRPGGGTEGNVD
jgi:hypothetical protein